MTSASCESCILVALLVFNCVKLLLNFVDFFYRASTFRTFLISLFPVAKIGFIACCLLKINLPQQHVIAAHFLLAEIIVAELAFVSSFMRKIRDRAYLIFLVLVVVENLIAAQHIGAFGIWKNVFSIVSSKFAGSGVPVTSS